ncbi:MAG TPA: chemotaxis protein CheA, partial [Polyangiales bacterium]
MTALAPNETFANEAFDLLEQIEQAALLLERAPDDAEHVNLLFRAFHTIKGSAAMVGLQEISSFTHHVETTLDAVRTGALSVSPELVSVILNAKDHILALLNGAIDGTPAPRAQGDAIIAQLAKLGGRRAGEQEKPRGPAMRTTYHVSFRLRRSESNLTDPALLLAELSQLGTASVSQTAQAEGEFGERYDVELTTQAQLAAIRDVFIFVEPGSELKIEQGLSEFVTEPPSAIDAAPPERLVAEREGSAQVHGNVQASDPSKDESRKRAARKEDTVRVPSERLDLLVKLVGELVINQSRLQQACAQGSRAEMADPVEAMERLITELRDSVLGIRMMPIGPTFRRFERLARDLSAQLEKEIELVTEGDETELDKTVLDQLGDPLVHMIRNSMDHGIEPPAERAERGKPVRGRVLLTASHDGGQVVITIKDDGRGLDASAIRAKAEEKGLIEPGAHLSEQDTYDLIMKPGFSTAKAVTQLSGRGVGMDVVKRTIESLRGTLSISSQLGAGTTMRLSLPLTLAIIDGLLVEIAGDRFIVPMELVTENVELTRHERSMCNGRNAVAVRGELVPYIRLRELFGMTGREPDLEKVVLVHHDGQRVGLVVDQVIGIH